jgi:pyruvate dehydrogenase E1 component
MTHDAEPLETPAAEEENLAQSNGVYDDSDPTETGEWVDSFQSVLRSEGPDRARFLLDRLVVEGGKTGAAPTFTPTTPYLNTIPVSAQPEYPGERELERRIKGIIRWNAAAMVIRGIRKSKGLGGHLATFASAATLYQVGFMHFFRGKNGGAAGDQIYYQGHASPGIYALGFLEGIFSEQHLDNFRRELAEGGGLSSYPHPWLMPNFWEFPSVSMGLAGLMSIYQARFNRYLHARGLADTSQSRVWAFLGDGEMDEPESLGAISHPPREGLDNLTWVVNCNLQRLDGPVRGNGKIIQELEAIFRGAGWNVIKVVWGGAWDEHFADDADGALARRVMEVIDGQYQKYSVETGEYIRNDFIGDNPALARFGERLDDEHLRQLFFKRGGHDPAKVYAAYHTAVNTKGKPTVILAKTVKGYSLGDAIAGRNTAHQKKEMTAEAIRGLRDRYDLPIPVHPGAPAGPRRPHAPTPRPQQAPGRHRRCQLRRLPQGHRPARSLHHHGLRLHPQQDAQGQDLRQAHRPHRPR